MREKGDKSFASIRTTRRGGGRGVVTTTSTHVCNNQFHLRLKQRLVVVSVHYVLTWSPCLERVSFNCRPDFSKRVLIITSRASLTHSEWVIASCSTA